MSNEHVLPILKNHYIISLGELCYAWCEVLLTEEKLLVFHNNRVILGGIRKSNVICYLHEDALVPNEYHHLPHASHDCSINSIQVQLIQNAHQTTGLKDGIQFLHATLFSPEKWTLVWATLWGFFTSWPLLAYGNLSQNINKTLATNKGHIKRVRQNIRSAKQWKVRGQNEVEENYSEI